MDGEDKDIVLQLLENNNIRMKSNGIVTLQRRIILQDQIIYSKCSKRVTKRNSYTVTFTDPQAPTHVKYGRVNQFLTCPADSPDSMHVAIIEGLEVQHCEELVGLNYPPEIMCLSPLLYSDFVSVVIEGPTIAIPIEHIVMKCFDVTTIGFCGITTLVNQCEVAK